MNQTQHKHNYCYDTDSFYFYKTSRFYRSRPKTEGGGLDGNN